MQSLLNMLPQKTFRKVTFLLIVVAVFALYGPSLGNDFAHDDGGQIVENPYVQDLRYLPRAFTSCIWEAYMGTCKGAVNYYRPMQHLSYLFTYIISSHPGFFHFVNIVYYILLNYAIFLLLQELFKQLLKTHYRLPTILALLTFLFHPVHTAPVMWIASVPDLLYSLFTVLAFYAYLRSKSIRYVAFLFFLGVLSKEPAAFLPFVLLVYDIFWEKQRINVTYLLRYWPFAMFSMLYLALRVTAIGGLAQGPGYFEFTLWERFLNSTYVFGEYLKKVLWPYELNPFIPFQPIETFSDPRFLQGFFLSFAFALVLGWAVWKRQKVMILGLAIYLLFMFPLFIFLNALGENVVSERYLLLPSLGMTMIFGYYVARIFNLQFSSLRPFGGYPSELGSAEAGGRQAISNKFSIFPSTSLRVFDNFQFSTGSVLGTCIMLSVLGLSGPRVFAQNKVWKSTKTLYEHIHAINISKGHLADVTYYNLAVIYEEEGRTEDAKRVYEEIVVSGKKFPSVYKAYNNLGKMYTDEGRFEDAVAMYRKSIEENPQHRFAFNNLGIAFMEEERYLDALEQFIRALDIDPRYEEAQHNMELLYKRVSGLPLHEEDREDTEDEEYEASLSSFLTELLRNSIWLDWEYRQVELRRSELWNIQPTEAMRVLSVETQMGGAMNVKIAMNPSLSMKLSPAMIFFTQDGELHFILEYFKTFDPETSEISLLVIPEKRSQAEDEMTPSTPTTLELFVVLSDFRYYKFVL